MLKLIGLIGIRKNTPLEIREKFIIKPKKHKEYMQELLKEMKEVVLLATCNRTEIYFNASLNEEELLKKIFEIFGWDYEYEQYIFITAHQDVYRHLFEVCCGFHSKILGEDQILGQVKESYEESLDIKAVTLELHRLFQEPIRHSTSSMYLFFSSNPIILILSSCISSFILLFLTTK